MIGDKYYFLKNQIPKANIIASKLSKYKNKKILVIGGESGTSKSEIAIIIREILFKKYKKKSFIVHFDDYYNTSWHNRNKVRKETNIIGKDEINWNKINKIITDFKNNNDKLYVQEIDIFLDKILYHIVPCKNIIDVLILEGLYACYTPNVDFKVYLEGTIIDTYEFRKKRMKENPNDKFRQYVLEKESNCVRQSKKYADLIIPFIYK